MKNECYADCYSCFFFVHDRCHNNDAEIKFDEFDDPKCSGFVRRKKSMTYKYLSYEIDQPSRLKRVGKIRTIKKLSIKPKII